MAEFCEQFKVNTWNGLSKQKTFDKKIIISKNAFNPFFIEWTA